MRSIAVSSACLVLIAVSATAAADLGEISNYREYSAVFASAGQPTQAQLEEIGDAGFERVIYIAFTGSGNAIPNEDEIVRNLGMEYVHIPVVWANPTLADFEHFAAVMRRDPDSRTLLHCQVNYRASAFSFLYRVIYGGVAIAEAKADMNSVWQPDETWRDFIFAVLDAHGIAPDCPGCRWDVSE